MDFVVVKDLQHGIERAKQVLYEEVDRKTVLFLSGGKTPKALYEALAQEKILTPAAVGMTDERFGNPFHENSNELMIKDSGFLDYLRKTNVPFYSMLDKKLTVDQAARNYDNVSRDLFFKFPRSVAILGIGLDGHIASIMPNRKDFTDPLFEKEEKYLYASSIDDPKKYGKRVTLTFAGLSLVDKLIVFVFGKEKKKALKASFTPGFLTDIPARFFQEPDIAKKTLFITDQKI